MASCPVCGRSNPPAAVFCGGCGLRLAHPGPAGAGEKAGTVAEEATTTEAVIAAQEAEAGCAATRVHLGPLSSSGSSGEEDRLPRRLQRARSPARAGLAIAAAVGLLALAAATGYKVASKPGRVRPPQDRRLRLLPPPAEPADEGDQAEQTETEEASPAGGSAAPAAADARAVAAAGARSGSASPEPGRGEVAGKTRPAPAVVNRAADKPNPKPKPWPALGPPPSSQEIEACINKRKPRLRACADQATQRGEIVSRGYATATMNPDGKLTDVWVPGGGSFGDLLNQSLGNRGEPDVPPTPAQNAVAGLMLKAMIQAAKADGRIDAEEQRKLLGNLGEVSAAEKRFVEAQMKAPIDIAGLAGQVPRGLEAQVYMMSLMAIDLDNQTEATYLHQLATALGLDKRVVNQIHAKADAPALYV
jgi:hypothetical protein